MRNTQRNFVSLGSKNDSLSKNNDRKKPAFLPRLAKQKVLDKFIDLSTADVFNRSTNFQNGMNQTDLTKGGFYNQSNMQNENKIQLLNAARDE